MSPRCAMLACRRAAALAAHRARAPPAAGRHGSGARSSRPAASVNAAPCAGLAAAAAGALATAGCEAADDDDDPTNDEETSCSICLINRQGPCRKYWLPFERCMKEHAAATTKEGKDDGGEKEEEVGDAQEGVGDGEQGKRELATSARVEEHVEEQKTAATALEAEWEAFMEKSIAPGEDDDEDDEDDEDDNDEDEDEDDDGDEDDSGNDVEDDKSEGESENENAADNADTVEDDDGSKGDSDAAASPAATGGGDDDDSLVSRCDQVMLPWIGCVQAHRNTYGLITNAFYQEDYVDPLEDAIPAGRRTTLAPREEAPEEEEGGGGAVAAFQGAEIDLGSWREHAEAAADGGGAVAAEDGRAAGEPHLVNGHAKFLLADPRHGRPLEVAYVKDQRGRLLGFDSFSKREDGAVEGECTFNIIPDETTSVTAYAIYRGEAPADKEGGGAREDLLYHTPAVLLPKIAAR